MKNSVLKAFLPAVMAVTGFLSSCKKDLPEVTTYPLQDVGIHSAKGYGEAVYGGKGGVTRRGVCWSIHPGPDTGDHIAEAGPGEGPFFVDMDNLTDNTTYYVRAFASNKYGTAYGKERHFTTLSETPPSFQYNGTTYYVHPMNDFTSVHPYFVWAPASGTTGAADPGDGTLNTAMLDALPDDYLAKVCSRLDAYGHSDWYMPSKDELNAMYLNKAALGISGGFYWSSTEFDGDLAWSQNFGNGAQQDEPKSAPRRCRCIRK